MDNEPFLKFDDFNGGVVDAFGQGKEPENSFADSQNLTPFLKKSLRTVHGYSTVGGLTTLPTGFPIPGGAGTYDVAKIVSEIYPFSSQNPIPYDGKVYFFQDNQGSPVNHVMLDTWFKGSTTPQTGNGGFVPIDEHLTWTVNADTIVAGASTFTITVTDAAVHGLSLVNDYYSSPPWVLRWARGSTIEGYATVVGYSVSSGIATITTKEDIGSGKLNFALVTGDTLTLWRWFHQFAILEPTFTGPDFGTQPGQCFQSSGRVRGCGGPSDNVNYKPWIAQYIDRTFFTGHASAERYQGTYVDEMRCRYPALSVASTSVSATGTPVVLPDASYSFYASYEYDGYEEGELTYQAGAGGSISGSYFIFDLYFPFAYASKRITALNLYVSQFDPTTGAESDAYFIRRYDLVTPSSAELDTTYGWQWDLAGFDGHSFVIDKSRGTPDNSSYNVRFDGTDWQNRGGTYLSRTGRVQESNSTTKFANLGKLDYITWQYTENVSGRQFFANFYDPNTKTTEVNAMRFTGFDVNSNATPDVIPSDLLYNQTNVSPDTGSAIQGLSSQNGWLYAFLNPGIYGFSITAYPEQWVKYPVSTIDGLYSIKSLGKLPEGNGIFFADVDHFKVMHNQRITPITLTIPNLYYNLTGKSTIRAWYDKIDRALCFSDGVSEQTYRGYLGMAYTMPGELGQPAIPWYPTKYANTVEFVTMQRDASVIFTNQTGAGVFKFHASDTTFFSAGIVPYLKTNSYFMDDQDSVSKGLVDRVHIHLYNKGDSGTFDCEILIDANTYTWSNIDKTAGHIFLKIPATTPRYGRHLVFEFNNNASGMYASANIIQLTEIVFYGQKIKFFVKNET